MALFGDKSTGDYVTRTEASDALEDYVRKDETGPFVADLAELKGRVRTLEVLAEQLKRSNPVGRSETLSAARQVRATETRDPIDGGRVGTRTTASVTGVDYGAIAFGLKEISRKVGLALGESAGDLRTEYAGAVQYFADVFAKADTGFDADTFKRQSGV